jgi:hypothetical protein
MTDSQQSEHIANLLAIARRISVQPRETELRNQVKSARARPSSSLLFTFRVINAIGSIEHERSSALSQLKSYASKLDHRLIEAFRVARVLDALIELQTYLWLSDDIVSEVRGLIARAWPAHPMNRSGIWCRGVASEAYVHPRQGACCRRFVGFWTWVR